MFCSKCGENVPENANFCLKCGIRTSKGVESGVPVPWSWEQEIEKTLSTAGKEIEKAFITAKESIRKTIKREPNTCSNCGEKNLYDAKFCNKCGKKT